MSRPEAGAPILASLLLAGLLLAACAAPARSPAAPPPAAGPDPAVPLLVVRHAWHSGVVLRSADLPAGSPLRAAVGDAPWIELGFGDRRYYPTPDPPAWMAVAAVLWPTPGVVAVTARRGPAEALPGDERLALAVDPAGIDRLHARVLASLATDARGELVPVPTGYPPPARFYAAAERFHLLNTCNAWTAGLLRAAGVPLAAPGGLGAGELLAGLEPVARRLRPLPATP